MSMISSQWAGLPGIAAAIETFEQAWSFGPAGSLIWSGQEIYSGALDAGNTPTTTLRMGLVMGRRTSDGKFAQYSPTASDGTEVAQAILPTMLKMLNVSTQVAEDRFYGLITGGRVKAANLLLLDGMARAQMADRFVFDDDFPGRQWFPFKRFVSKATGYQVLASDNMTLFDNVGATGSVTFTLPAIANGYFFGFRVQADQTVVVASSEGANMIALNNASANSVAFQTGTQKIGGVFWVYSNPAGTKWIVENHSAGANTVTVA